MVIFKSKQKKFEDDLKITLFGKRSYPTENVKHLGAKIVTNFSWQFHVNDLSTELNRGNALLFKMGKYVTLLKYSLRDSGANYIGILFAEVNSEFFNLTWQCVGK